MKISMTGTRKGLPFNTGDCLIEVITWSGLTLHVKIPYNENYDSMYYNIAGEFKNNNFLSH